MNFFLVGILQFVWVLASLFLQFSLGVLIVSKIRNKMNLKGDDLSPLQGLFCFSLGLIVHLWLVFLLKQHTGVAWWLASFLPLIPALFGLNLAVKYLKSYKFTGSINFLLWFFLVVSLGTTLFQANKGIETPWINNYGDLTWHLGIISNFVLGDRFPIEYHLFPGITLSYPFFVNLWSSLLWWPNPSYQSLSLIFTLQWSIAWIAVYIILRGNRNYVLPWALLFAGGSFQYWGQESWRFIEAGHPWVVFLASVWITQRAAMMGVWIACLATVLFLSARESKDRDESVFRVFQAGLILSLAALVHTHFVVSIGLFIFLSLLIAGMFPKISPSTQLKIDKKHYLAFACALLPGLLALPYLVGKSHITKIILGWTGVSAKVLPSGQVDYWGQLISSLSMWTQDVWPVFLVFGFIFVFTKDLFNFLVLSLCFLTFNLVKIAVWEWDQLKFFIGLYIVVICMCSTLKRPRALIIQLVCVILCLPGIAETAYLFQKGQLFTVFSTDDLRRARLIANNTLKSDIIAGSPAHNHPVLLSGRRLFYGYEGTLGSHGIDPGEREKRRAVNNSLSKIAECVASGAHDICPSYVYYSNLERKMWNASELDRYFDKTNLSFLYKVR